jgi:dihydrofolate synthase/folylpolyglutamate synthase
VAARLRLNASGKVTLTVGGTNGKGSSATLAAAIYRASGYRVGLYTSPHLLRYNERIVINGEPVADADIVRAFEAVERAREAIELTYFEFGTLAALWLFHEANVDMQVLEVGLGGQLDAVNIVDADCAIVTNIGLDHQDWLGPDRDSIGREKAGIFRRNKPAIVAERVPPQSVLSAARSIGARLLRLGYDFDYSTDAVAWRWCGSGEAFDSLPLPGLPGEAQLRNASGVIAAIAALQTQRPVHEAAIRAALPALSVRGRFERHGRWILDVAHNVESAQALADNIAELGLRPRFVVGMLSDKPVGAMLKVLEALSARFEFVSLPGPRGLSAADLREQAIASGIAPALIGEEYASPQDAVRQCAEFLADETIVICGSFVTVGLALQVIRP